MDPFTISGFLYYGQMIMYITYCDDMKFMLFLNSWLFYGDHVVWDFTNVSILVASNFPHRQPRQWQM